MKILRARSLTTMFSGTVLALLFAGLWLVAQNFELWSDGWQARVGRKAPVTVRLPADHVSRKCPDLIPRGAQLVEGGRCAELARQFEAARRPIQPLKVFGSFAFYLVLASIISAYMRRKNMGRARWLRSQTTVFVLLTVMAVGSKAMLLLTPLSPLILPVAVVPLASAYYLGRRVSFGVSLTAAVLASSLVNFDFQVLAVHLVAGAGSVIALGRRKRVRYLVRGGAMAAWVAVLAAVVTTLVFDGTLDIHDSLVDHFDPRSSLWLAALFSGLGSGLVALVLSPFVGLMVGEVSRGRLLDLQDLDHPLLRRLQERAPSTWAHSRAMANLAEAAAHAIGGDALLVRVGAHFHDVGKCARPEYFIENQEEGKNPHDQLSPHESARAIFHHVIDGVRLLRQEGVPEDVIEFAYSHHGTSVLEFFWHKHKSEGTESELTERDFHYPGHKPSTRETGILMLVDAVEAAARTVDQPDKSHFEQLVQRIVFTKLAQGQLDESGLSLADLRIVANTLIDTLVSMYHGRIKYPWQTESKGLQQPVSADETGPQARPGSGAQPVVEPERTPEPAERASTPPPAQTPQAPVQPAPAPSPAQPEPQPAPAPSPPQPEPRPAATPVPAPVAPVPASARTTPVPAPVAPAPAPARTTPVPAPVAPAPAPARTTPVPAPVAPAPAPARTTPVPAPVAPAPVAPASAALAPAAGATPDTFTGPAPKAPPKTETGGDSSNET